MQLQLHYITQHYSTLLTLITLHYATTTTTTAAATASVTTTTLHYQCYTNYITLRHNYKYTTLHYTTLDYTTLLQYTTIHYTNYTTPQLQLQLHHTTSSSCGWVDHYNHCNHSKKHNFNHLSVHQWTRSAIRDSQQPTSPIGFLCLKLPPPPCAVLLVTITLFIYTLT